MRALGLISNGYRVNAHQECGEERERARQMYKGRHWRLRKKNEERTLPCMPQLSKPKQNTLNLIYLEKAKRWLETMTTVEEKSAQLCLYQTKALYEADEQHETLKLIQGWQIGGLVFCEGQLQRQNYLIEQYQKATKIPLLIGNDFLHGLSCYSGDEPLQRPQNLFQIADMGKAVATLNRTIHVDFQFDKEREEECYLSEEYTRSFRQGIKQAHGLVARAEPCKSIMHSTPLALTHGMSQLQVRPEIKSLSIFDFKEQEVTEALVLDVLRKGEYHVFLGSGEAVRRVITLLSTAVLKGKISEAEIDRHVLQILYLKIRLQEEK